MKADIPGKESKELYMALRVREICRESDRFVVHIKAFSWSPDLPYIIFILNALSGSLLPEIKKKKKDKGQKKSTSFSDSSSVIT